MKLPRSVFFRLFLLFVIIGIPIGAAFAASTGDRLKAPVMIGQGTAVTEKIVYDLGLGGSNPYIQSTAGGAIQISDTGTSCSTSLTAPLLVASTSTSSPLFFGTGSGSVSAPVYSFTGDTNTGIYRFSDGNIGFTSNGVYAALIGSGEADFGGVANAYFPDGSVTAPGISFSTDSNTGIYKFGADAIGFSTGGVYRALITAAEADFTGTATVAVPAGTSGAPGIVIGGGGTTGFYRSSNTVGVSVTGTSRFTIDSGGATITGAGSGNTPHACTRRTSSGTGVTNATVTCSANEIVTGGGCFSSAGLISRTRPDTTGSWECVFDSVGNVTAYAICCLQ